MIERVKASLRSFEAGWLLETGSVNPMGRPYEKARSRAVIAAMRLPTEAMLKAGGAVSQQDGDFNDVCAESCWRAMIDAALTPPTNS